VEKFLRQPAFNAQLIDFAKQIFPCNPLLVARNVTIGNSSNLYDFLTCAQAGFAAMLATNFSS
jgi:hypothetical protein